MTRHDRPEKRARWMLLKNSREKKLLSLARLNWLLIRNRFCYKTIKKIDDSIHIVSLKKTTKFKRYYQCRPLDSNYSGSHASTSCEINKSLRYNPLCVLISCVIYGRTGFDTRVVAIEWRKQVRCSTRCIELSGTRKSLRLDTNKSVRRRVTSDRVKSSRIMRG